MDAFLPPQSDQTHGLVTAPTGNRMDKLQYQPDTEWTSCSINRIQN